MSQRTSEGQQSIRESKVHPSSRIKIADSGEKVSQKETLKEKRNYVFKWEIFYLQDYLL